MTSTSNRSSSMRRRDIPSILQRESARSPAKSLAQSGQAMTEYLILTAIIAVGSIAVVQILGKNLHSRLAMVAAALGGDKKEIASEKVKEEVYKARDLGDFNDGFIDNSAR